MQYNNIPMQLRSQSLYFWCSRCSRSLSFHKFSTLLHMCFSVSHWVFFTVCCQCLRELASPTPKSVHFPLKFPNISLRCRAAVVSPAPDFPHARGGPDVSLYRFKLPFLLPFLPDDTEVVEVVILDNTGDAFNHLFQHINEEHNDENGMPRRNDRCVFEH